MNEEAKRSGPLDVIGDLVNQSKKPLGTPWLAWIVWLGLSSILVLNFSIQSGHGYSSIPDGVIDWATVIDWTRAIAYLSAFRIAYELIVLAHAALLAKSGKR